MHFGQPLIHRLWLALWRRVLSRLMYRWVASLYSVRFKGAPMLVGYPQIKNAGAISFGRAATLASLPYANPLGNTRPCTFESLPGALIYIGDHFSASGCCILAAKRIEIGHRVTLGANVTVLDNDMHSLDPALRHAGAQYSRIEPVSIGDDCWIGANAVVLRGVSIGARTIIGAGVVLRSSVDSDCIVTAAPNEVRTKRAAS